MNGKKRGEGIESKQTKRVVGVVSCCLWAARKAKKKHKHGPALDLFLPLLWVVLEA